MLELVMHQYNEAIMDTDRDRALLAASIVSNRTHAEE